MADRHTRGPDLPNHVNAFCPFHSQGWHGRIAPGWQRLFEDIDQWLAINRGEMLVDFPSREVRRVETPEGVVYVKLLRSGGDARGSRRLLANLKWLVRPSRALAIMRISQSLLAEDFICPVPVLAARRRDRAGWPTDIFISLECRGINLAERLSAAANAGEASSVLAMTAREMRRLHEAGFVHGDCTPYNLAFTDQDRLILFDNDRTVRSSPPLRRYRQERSLANLGLRLTQMLQNLQPFREFLAYYAESPGEARRIMALTRKRLRSKGLEFA
ncbi:MAG TPA: lipopolysaccharide kinase InaA family protein [Pseudomonas sp.]|nr:lipopolysaccharide kinase InaA family protein [Pseudomonas sp.]